MSTNYGPWLESMRGRYQKRKKGTLSTRPAKRRKFTPTFGKGGRPTLGTMYRASLAKSRARGKRSATRYRRRSFRLSSSRNTGNKASGSIITNKRVFKIGRRNIHKPAGVGLRLLKANNVFKITEGPAVYNQQTIFEIDVLKTDMFTTTKCGISQILDFLASTANASAAPTPNNNYVFKSHTAKFRLVNSTTEDAVWDVYVMRCIDDLTIGERAGNLQNLWRDHLVAMNADQTGFSVLDPNDVGLKPPLKGTAFRKSWKCVAQHHFSMSAGSQHILNYVTLMNKVLCADDLQYKFDSGTLATYLFTKNISYKLLFVGNSMPMSVKSNISLIGRPAPVLNCDLEQKIVGWHIDLNQTQYVKVDSADNIPTAGPYTMINDMSDVVQDFVTD